MSNTTSIELSKSAATAPELDPDSGTALHDGQGRRPLVPPGMVWPAVRQSFSMLNPLNMARNPVMFVTEIGALVTTLVTIQAMSTGVGAIGYFTLVTIML